MWSIIQDNDLEVGKIGEHLVCAYLISQGHKAFLSDQGLPYDVVVDLGDVGLIRIQVKTVRGPSIIPQRKSQMTGYLFHARRHGKNGRRSYESNSFDMFAFVALDSPFKIGFTPINDVVPSSIVIRNQTHTMRNGQLRSKWSFDSLSWDTALRNTLNARTR
jgi:hypothetical protein